MKRFVYQFAVLIRETANRRFELRESLSGP
jgi:hypothetical protein